MQLLCNIHGDLARNRTFMTYELDLTERAIQIVNLTVLSDGKHSQNNEIKLPWNNPLTENVYTEEFARYILAYVTQEEHSTTN